MFTHTNHEKAMRMSYQY